MDERLNLREFQHRLAERLKGAAAGEGGGAKLGFVAGGRHWLVALDQVSEVVTVNHLARAPWVQPWFLGVAGVRGAIYGCTDLAGFLGIAPPETPEDIRMLLANARFDAHAALRIDQALGLRNIAGMTRRPAVDAPDWQLDAYLDEQGVEWTEISLDKLLADPRFLRVAV